MSNKINDALNSLEKKTSTPMAIAGAIVFIFAMKFAKEITKNFLEPKKDNIFKQRRERNTKNS